MAKAPAATVKAKAAPKKDAVKAKAAQPKVKVAGTVPAAATPVDTAQQAVPTQAAALASPQPSKEEAKMTAAAPAVKTVKMDDDRVVDFVGKRKMLKEEIFKDGKVYVRVDFITGETRTLELHDKLMQKFAAHGASQKLGDEIAGVEDVEDAIMAIDELMARLQTGEWSAKRQSDGIAGTSILARALMEQSGKPMDAVKLFLNGKTAAEKMAMRKNPKVAPIIKRLEDEKAARSKPKAEKPGLDVTGLLDQLSGKAPVPAEAADGEAATDGQADGGEAAA